MSAELCFSFVQSLFGPPQVYETYVNRTYQCGGLELGGMLSCVASATRREKLTDWLRRGCEIGISVNNLFRSQCNLQRTASTKGRKFVRTAKLRSTDLRKPNWLIITSCDNIPELMALRWFD
ncbi:MAG: hypothetical protein ACTS7I_00505 [Candidatus Hodgkinia cicadicola]